MARNDPQVNFRIPVELKQRLEAMAEKNNRSFKAEIEYRLDNWEGAIEQIDRAHEGWEVDRVRLDEVKRHLDAMIRELGEANSRYETLEDRYQEYREETAFKLAEVQSEALPSSLLKRVELRAAKTGRTPQQEIVLALEEAFPPPAPLRAASRFLNLEMLVLQWYLGDWHLVDWDSWGRFRAGENPAEIMTRSNEGTRTFVIAVVDDASGLTNLVSHIYNTTEEGNKPATLGYLTENEVEEYNRLMSASFATKEDERRLRFFQEKMAPGLLLPPNSIPKLREILGQLAPTEIVESLLLARGLIS